MSELAKLLRYLVQGDKEAKITSVTTYGDPAQFETQLTLGQPRKGLSVFNNSDTASGELLYGFSSGMTATEGSQPIPAGAYIDIPVADENNSPIELYFMNVNSGERGDLRVQEIA